MHNVKPPAFVEHAPSVIKYEALMPEQEMKLKEILGLMSGCLKKMAATSYQYPFGFYQHQLDQQNVRFYKILPSDFESLEMFSLELERDLSEAGANCRKMLAHFRDFEGEQVLVIDSPFLEFEPFSVSEASMRVLAQQLKRIHNTLKQHPKSESVKVNWLNKKAIFNQLYEHLTDKNIKKSLLQTTSVTAESLTVFEDYLELLDFDLLEAQIVHGDLNIGNVLIQRQEPWIIDFENAHYSYFPVGFDIGMLLERLCLAQVGPSEFWRYARVFLESYIFDETELVNNMRALSIRSMSLLLENHLLKGTEFNDSEWQKFYRNLQQLEQLT